jgi:hypothetical protein
MPIATTAYDVVLLLIDVKPECLFGLFLDDAVVRDDLAGHRSEPYVVKPASQWSRWNCLCAKNPDYAQNPKPRPTTVQNLRHGMPTAVHHFRMLRERYSLTFWGVIMASVISLPMNGAKTYDNT